jgi:hypothetical protein
MSPIIATAQEDALVDVHVNAIRAILEADVFEPQMGAMLRDYCNEHLQSDHELFSEVHDRLARDGIISKSNFRLLWLS